MAPTMQRVLILGSETPALQRVVPVLPRAELQVQQLSDPDEGIARVRQHRYDLVILRYPFGSLALQDFVVSVRATASACRNAGVLVLADPDSVEEVSGFLGRGINRIVSLEVSSDRLLDAIADLLAVTPRLALRAVVQLELWLEQGAHRLLTLTQNVSSSGMLVLGGHELPVGTRVTFELLLPGQLPAVCGELEVTRHADRRREQIDGFGARIVSFTGDGGERLRGFLRQT
jgi:DNA-binding NarL/FixJ family response regulator